MKIAVTGSKGLIGRLLMLELVSRGHQVIPIVRGTSSSGEVAWNPDEGTIDTGGLEGVDAVIHLAGAGVGDRRWTPRYKALILSSRTRGTSTLAEALAAMPVPPKVLLSASAIGYYGVRGDEPLTEASEPGEGFLADVCAQWEAATAPASAAGVRVAHLRTGIVLSASGGALGKQLRLFKAGLGARIGDGNQFFSWITRRDAVAAMCMLIERERLEGPFNLVSPNPVTNRTFTASLARSLHRPAKLVIPMAALRLVAGAQMTAEFFMASQRVVPQRLLDSGFEFSDPELPAALAVALADRP